MNSPPPITLTPDQSAALQRLFIFMADPNERVFVLSGNAGCGKSSLVKYFLEQLPAHEKTMKLKSIVHLNPNERILQFLKIYKRNLGLDSDEKIIIDVTRKEMANSTGLAIETVIRAVKKMEREEKLQLINHKIYY